MKQHKAAVALGKQPEARKGPTEHITEPVTRDKADLCEAKTITPF